MSRFKQFAKRAVDSYYDSHHSHSFQAIAEESDVRYSSRNAKTFYRNVQAKRSQSGADGSSNDEDISPYDLSSGGSSDDIQHVDVKKKGLVYQKTENFLTQIRDWIAMSDVFISRGENPPFVACLQVSVWFIPLLLTMCIWDTLCVTVFEIPYLCTIDYPGFLLVWHFVMMILAMYGFMLSYLSSGWSPRTKLAGISLVVHYLLLFYRVFVEIYFNGYRGQWKLYYERSKKVF